MVADFNLNDKVLVIARYREPLINWIDSVPKDIKQIVYNKGEADIPFYRQLDNVGRESHTYLHFILEFYDNLPSHCLFFQDDVLKDHGGGGDRILKELNNFLPEGHIPKETYKGFGWPIPVKGASLSNPSAGVCYSPSDLFREYLGMDPEKVKDIDYMMPVCAFFYVHRNNILRHKKEVYQKLYDQHYVHTSMPVLLEYSWHLIFDDIYYQ